MQADLCIDATFLRSSAVGGAEHMLKGLVHGFLNAPNSRELTILTAETPWMTHPRVKWRGARVSGNRFIDATMSLSTVDAVSLLCPNYFTPPNARLHSTQIVTIIHDLQYLHFPSYFSRRKRAWLRASHALTLRAADRVVAISRFVAEDILRNYGAKWAGKLEVIDNPVDWQRFGKPSVSDQNQAPYVLGVAAHYPHKNIVRLIDAMRLLRADRRLRETRLVLTGQAASKLVGTRNVPLVASEPWIEVTGYVDDVRLGQLYQGASALAFPTLFEGFGLPVIEALGLGIPVVTAMIDPLPDVSMGLARYVEDVTDTKQIARGLADVLLDRAAWCPNDEAITKLRERYDTRRIGSQYLAVLSPTPRSNVCGCLV